jgi:hypothetical protein
VLVLQVQLATPGAPVKVAAAVVVVAAVGLALILAQVGQGVREDPVVAGIALKVGLVAKMPPGQQLLQVKLDLLVPQAQQVTQVLKVAPQQL